MKRITLIALATLAVSGCASNGDSDDTLTSLTNSAKSAGSAVVDGVGGFFKGYESGVKITEAEMKTVKTRKEVISKFGHPNEKEEIRGNLVYKYPYIMMPHFGTTVNEYTVFEFDKNDNVVESYKTNKKDTGIAALDSALGM